MNTICPNNMLKTWGQKTIFLCDSLPQKRDSHLCHAAFHLGRFFFFCFLLWEAVLELLCWDWSEWEFTSSAEVVGLQSVISYTLNRPDQQWCCEWVGTDFYIHQRLTYCWSFSSGKANSSFPGGHCLPLAKVWKDGQKENRGEKIWCVDSWMAGAMQWKESERKRFSFPLCTLHCFIN